jgi:hypothetical protein
MIVDIMKTGEGWYHCASWCGREVTVRGNFCAPCAWLDALMCVTLGIDYREDVVMFELDSPYRGRQIDYLKEFA